MNICIVNCFDTYEHRVDLLLDAFKSQGHRAIVLSSDFRHIEKVKRIEKKNGYKFFPAKTYSKNLSVQRMRSHSCFSKNVAGYIERHIDKIDLIHKGKVGEVYNVGGHNEMKNIDIVKLICKELGKPESLITHVEDRKGHDMRYAIDPTKIHNELGWLPETKFEDGIKKTIKWYLENREWWETIISGEYQNYYEKMYGNRAEV